MTPDEFRDRMRDIAADPDTEGSHVEADQLLCNLILEVLPDYADGVDEFKRMSRWYS